MQSLLQEISQRCFLSPELQQRITKDFKEKNTKKGEKILIQGNKANYLYFVKSGVLHNYYYHDGKQISSWFYSVNQFITSWFSFYAQKPSFEEIECLENCVLFKISYKDYQKLIADFPEFGNFARLIAEEMLTFLDEFSKGWSFLTAKEKYNLLLTYFPNIELRVKLGHIASFLGISQETFSRIRK
ncbi:Crp/Fnr family transcriptional regulator [Winogradskyella haliclonae]|uniref:Cyclic nucleotide-binding protein n=1 Tax=Winogradskyella haliclonae TaxID=2048558 RepID=A0ABQ2BZ21_9FLAO|nr:Crp/Fnr family transcriptional regulator [Winogradskyella haliclonae]GGI57745.1 cyclic nucleotide-binding protein [Winogradskyella haliclonae]